MKYWTLTLALLFLTLGLLPVKVVSARPLYVTPSQLIAAVNSYRASNGLPPYSENSILMGTAQGHANYMASTGIVAHTGAGGSSVTERLLNAGYPLAGDLSRGGWRSENILSVQEGASASDIIYSGYWQDALHQETMLSPNLFEIGAGVAVNGGLAYVVLDCAAPTGSGQQQAFTPSVGGTPGKSLADEYIVPITVSTPRADGTVIHVVQSGQSLWAIAIAYGVKIDQIRTLNKLGSNDIFPNQELTIKYAPTATPLLPTLTAVPTFIPSTSTFTFTPTLSTAITTPTETSQPESKAPSSNGTLAIIIILVALVAGGAGVWFGMRDTEG